MGFGENQKGRSVGGLKITSIMVPIRGCRGYLGSRA